MNERIRALNAAQKNLRTLSTFVVVCAVICIILIFRNPPFSIVFFLALMVFYLFYFRRKIRRYNLAVKSAHIEEGLRFAFKNISFQPRKGISGETIAQAGFLPAEEPGSILIRDTVKGSCRGRDAFLTDITTNYQSSVTDHKGKTRKVAEYLSGCYFDLALSRYKGASFLLWPRKCLTEQARRKYLAEKTERLFPRGEDGSALAGYFYLYTAKDGRAADTETSEKNGMTELSLPAGFLKAVRDLIEYTPATVAIQVTEDHLRIFLQNRFLYVSSIPLKAEITSQLLTANPFPEMRYLTGVADSLLS